MKSCRKILAVFSAVTIFYGGANVYAASQGRYKEYSTY